MKFLLKSGNLNDLMSDQNKTKAGEKAGTKTAA
jgi:hypothetical protein